jgi:acetyl-CoA carboxylase carboxyltransferase component
MSWQPELDELRAREAMTRKMGGAARVDRQRQGGRLNVRERIDRLLDRGTFHEIGAIAGKAEYDADGNLIDLSPANCVTGRGLVDGRPVMIAGDDFTVRGASADASIKEKVRTVERMAAEYRMPIIRMIEGSGGGGSVKTIETTGRANLPGGVGSATGLDLCGENMGLIPVVGLGLGSVAGLGAARLVASHYSVMVKNISAVFVAGPPVVEQLGEPRTKQELGGWEIQLAAGAVDHAVDTEEEAFAAARRFLSYLPGSIWDLPPRAPPSRYNHKPRTEFLLSVVPRDRRHAYHMRRIIEAVTDHASFFEMGEKFGRGIITGLARFDGWPVALMAGDPLYGGGAWDADACDKIIRFVDMAETFHLPVVHLVDCPGFSVGLAAERAGTIRYGVRALTAINQCTTPWCSIIIRNVYGVGGVGHQPQNRLALRYAWPSASWGSLPLEGGIEAAYRAELDDAPDEQAHLEKIKARLDALRSPMRTAEAYWIEEIIDPRDTRKLLLEFANLAAPLRTPGRAGFSMRP